MQDEPIIVLHFVCFLFFYGCTRVVCGVVVVVPLTQLDDGQNNDETPRDGQVVIGLLHILG